MYKRILQLPWVNLKELSGIGNGAHKTCTRPCSACWIHAISLANHAPFSCQSRAILMIVTLHHVSFSYQSPDSPMTAPHSHAERRETGMRLSLPPHADLGVPRISQNEQKSSASQAPKRVQLGIFSVMSRAGFNENVSPIKRTGAWFWDD